MASFLCFFFIEVVNFYDLDAKSLESGNEFPSNFVVNVTYIYIDRSLIKDNNFLKCPLLRNTLHNEIHK